MSGAPTVRLATANLLHGMTLRGRAGTDDALAGVGADLAPDVLALQEVDLGQDRSGGQDQARLVAGGAGLEHVEFHPTLVGTPGGRWLPVPPGGPVPPGPQYGVALASRWPLTDVRHLDLGWARAGLPLVLPNGRPTLVTDEPRGAVVARIETPLGPVTVASAHLSFVPGWNVVQLVRVVRALGRLPGPRLLLGDLNMPGLLARAARGWRPLATVATYPAPRPRIQFDHVLASGDLPGTVTDVVSHRMPLSDHCALAVTLTG